MKLVTGGGDGLSLWDASSHYQLHNKECAFDTGASVHGTTLTQNNQYIACCNLKYDYIVVFKENEDGRLMSHSHVTTEKGSSSVSYDRENSDVIACGTIGGDVCLVNVNENHTKTYTGHTSMVKCLQYNHSSTHLASGSMESGLFLHNVVSGQSYQPQQVNNNKVPVISLSYHSTRSQLLSTGSTSGSVYLWDLTTLSPYHIFTTAHTTLTTASVFSPVNELLLVTASLDKNIICYDINAKRPMIRISTGDELTCLDFLCDGRTVAAGTMTGRVIVYDLRKKNAPTHEYQAHSGSVHSLHYQYGAHPAKPSENTSVISSFSSVKSQKFKNQTGEPKQTKSQKTPSLSDSYTDMNIGTRQNKSHIIDRGAAVLPMRRSVTSNKNTLSEVSNRNKSSTTSSQSKTTATKCGTVQLKQSLLPTVLHSGQAPVTSPRKDKHHSSSSSKHLFHKPHMTAPIRPSTHRVSPVKTSSTQEDVNLINLEEISPIAPTVGISMGEINSEMSNNSCDIHTVTVTEEVTETRPSPSSPHQRHTKSESQPQENVADMIEEQFDSVQRFLVNLQVNMLKQFQEQQQWFSSVLQVRNENNSLKNEIEELREENRSLRSQLSLDKT